MCPSAGLSSPTMLSPSAAPPHFPPRHAPATTPGYFTLSIDRPAESRGSPTPLVETWNFSATSANSSTTTPFSHTLPFDCTSSLQSDDFRRAAESNWGRSNFNLSTPNFGVEPPQSTPLTSSRPHPARLHTHSLQRPTPATSQNGTIPSSDNNDNSVARGPSNSDVPSIIMRRQSTASNSNHPSPRHPPLSLSPTMLLQANGRRPSPLPDGSTHNRACPPMLNLGGVADMAGNQRSEIVPPVLKLGPDFLRPDDLHNILETAPSSTYLIFDLRVAPQYAQARIRGALSLCIPTTLLKRPTFNLQKLRQAFTMHDQRERFSAWRETKHLIVYDATSSTKREATSAMNTLRKFTNEGYAGAVHVLAGGYRGFATQYPHLIEHTGPAPAGPSLCLSSAAATASPGSSSGIPPVIGGVMLPENLNGPNPFFSNIRQNQDLVDGVGCMDLSIPPGLDLSGLPDWLRRAADPADHGKTVADRFLHIELAEKSRMQKAYSLLNLVYPPSSTQQDTEFSTLRLAGLEQGSKNRYKDVLPFEHTRVKLGAGRLSTCDYINASHLKPSRSHKRYIACQGPLPTTFEDFWSVVWDQDVRVIVMLTSESEGGQIKCHLYWTESEYGVMKLRQLSERLVPLESDKSFRGTPDGASPFLQAEVARRRASTMTFPQAKSSGEAPSAVVRKFALSHSGHPSAPAREVTHIHYPSWPDFGAPAQPSHLLALVELANVTQHAASLADDAAPLNGSPPPSPSESGMNDIRTMTSKNRKRGEAVPVTWQDAPEFDAAVRPMLVHCSAGCGRTGTFCTVDAAMDMLKRQRLQVVKKSNRRLERRQRQRPVWKATLSTTVEPTLREEDIDMDVLVNGTSASDVPPPAEPSPRAPNGNSVETDVDIEDPRLNVSWLDDDTVDLIAQTVEDFRCQRFSMVQSLRQFVLCYETIMEWVHQLQEQFGPAAGASFGVGKNSRARSGSLNMYK